MALLFLLGTGHANPSGIGTHEAGRWVCYPRSGSSTASKGADFECGSELTAAVADVTDRVVRRIGDEL